MFAGTAVSPFGECQPCGLESPRCFLLPPCELVYSLFAILVEEASLSVSGEDGRDRLAGTNVPVTTGTFHHGWRGSRVGWISGECYPGRLIVLKAVNEGVCSDVLEGLTGPRGP